MTDGGKRKIIFGCKTDIGAEGEWPSVSFFLKK